MIIPKGKALFRYCLGDKMPSNWTTQYHSPEYHSPTYGEKNQIGAFFFYCDETLARNVLNVAIQNVAKQGKIFNRNTITSCQTIADLNLLDLTKAVRPVQILNILYDKGVDILTTSFYKYQNYTKIPFSVIQDYHRYIMDNESTKDGTIQNKKSICGDKIDQFFNNNMGYIGQLMTDFNNGFSFKKQLIAKGYEGYLFMEENSGPTICIFNSSKLSKPCHTFL